MRDRRRCGPHRRRAATKGRRPRADGADDALFEGAVWVLTPSVESSDESFESLAKIIRTLGAEIVVLDAQRHESDYIKRRNLVAIKLGGALLCAGIVAAWVFIPGGIFIALSALAAIGLVSLGGLFLEKYNAKAVRARLHSKFEAIEEKYEKECVLQQEHDLSSDNTVDLQEELTTVRKFCKSANTRFRHGLTPVASTSRAVISRNL